MHSFLLVMYLVIKSLACRVGVCLILLEIVPEIVTLFQSGCAILYQYFHQQYTRVFVPLSYQHLIFYII